MVCKDMFYYEWVIIFSGYLLYSDNISALDKNIASLVDTINDCITTEELFHNFPQNITLSFSSNHISLPAVPSKDPSVKTTHLHLFSSLKIEYIKMNRKSYKGST